MKNSILNRFLKKATAGVLAGALVLSGVLFFPEAGKKVSAAPEGVHTEQLAIDSYVSGSDKTAPKPTVSAYADWVFAGWYTSDDCTEAVAASVSSGTYTAKFVPAEILSVRCQVLSGTVSSTDVSKLRLVSTVDNLKYNRVGFEIQMGEKSFQYDTKKVCVSIAEKEGGVSFNYAPSDFHSMAQYFTTVTLTNIKNARFTTGFYIRPYWETLDGTLVYGVSRYARVEDSYLGIVNVPVRLYTDADVAAGYLEVSYTSDYQYVGSDGGNIFGEMEVANAGSTIRCVGNVADISENVKADGMYVNLRFKKTGTNATGTFAVSAEDFCDNNEVAQTVAVSDVVYKEITKN